MKRLGLVVAAMSCVSSCAIMHHTQVGEVDSEIVLKGRRFEIRTSEVGFNLEEAGSIATAVTRGKAQKAAGSIQLILSLFQYGPRTGNPVFDPTYADMIFGRLRQECPNGRVSGLTSVRETAKYPVVSGEIVKIIGYCL